MMALENIASVTQITGQNNYKLNIDSLLSSISILDVSGNEELNTPWKYTVNFTSSDNSITLNSILSKPTSLIFINTLDLNSKKISSLEKQLIPRTLFGIITEFSQISVNKDETHYRTVISSRLALLANHHHSAIYQHQSAISVVEEVLRKHGYTGVDYRLELNNTYPTREFITQWNETDLNFIQRILADIGVWFRFESDAKHGCDVLIISDYEQGAHDAGIIIHKPPSGTVDANIESVWNLSLHSQTVESAVLVQDYNYRKAQTDMRAEINTQPKEHSTIGQDYRYGEHYKQKGENDDPETGLWYAKIRHEQKISRQIIIEGRSNQYSLAPGQRLRITGHLLSASLPDGILILSVNGTGNRTDNYELTFTAIPYDILKPYRPPIIEWPEITGTISARITSPDNDTYGYIDTQGRYRVKLDFDLKEWKKGEESLWLRLAKPYAGDTYGFHFPLIDGTEVAIAFINGNPDRPYIAHAMHDSSHPDHVSTANKHRNVIRTPANNKLRMDDKRGQEHIKLATEYATTQLNLGHLVDHEKQPRGEGFELRTDKHGAIRAGNGLLLSSYERVGKNGVKKASLDASETISLLKSGVSTSIKLSKRSDSHRAGKLEGADSFSSFVGQTTSNKSDALSFTEPSIVLSSPKGIAAVTPDSIYQYAQQNILLTSKQDTNIAAEQSFHTSAGKEYSVFAKQDLKLFSGEGHIKLQAHNGDIEVIADKSLKVVSNEDKIDINAKKEIILACGGAYIRIAGGNIELYAPGMIKHGAQGFPFSGPKNKPPTLYSFPEQKPLAPYIKQFVLVEQGTDKPIINREYQILNKDNQVIASGKTNAKGETAIVNTGYEEHEVIFRYKLDE